MKYEIFLVFTEKKSKLSFYFLPLREKTKFFPSHFSFILLSSARLVGIISGANCTRMAYNVILMNG